MYTELGKYLRHLRIDQNENLRDMAIKLDISSAFLSAVENGKKNIPNNFAGKISKCYELNENQINELNEKIALSSQEIAINLENASIEKQKVGILFARQFDGMDEETITKIRSIIQKGKSS